MSDLYLDKKFNILHTKRYYDKLVYMINKYSIPIKLDMFKEVELSELASMNLVDIWDTFLYEVEEEIIGYESTGNSIYLLKVSDDEYEKVGQIVIDNADEPHSWELIYTNGNKEPIDISDIQNNNWFVCIDLSKDGVSIL